MKKKRKKDIIILSLLRLAAQTQVPALGLAEEAESQTRSRPVVSCTPT